MAERRDRSLGIWEMVRPGSFHVDVLDLELPAYDVAADERHRLWKRLGVLELEDWLQNSPSYEIRYM